MRPKKKILLVGKESELAPIRYMLNLDWRYKAEIAGTKQEAIAALANAMPRYELLVIYFPFEGIRDLLTQARVIDRYLRRLVVCAAVEQCGHLHADNFVAHPSNAELLEWIKTMSARKRGPKPGSRKEQCGAGKTRDG